MDTDNILLDENSMSFDLYIEDELPKIQNTVHELPKIQNTVHELPKIQNTVHELPKIQNTVHELPRRIVTIQSEPHQKNINDNPHTHIVDEDTSNYNNNPQTHRIMDNGNNNTQLKKHIDVKKPLPLPVNDGGRKNNSDNSFKLGSLNVPKETAYLGIGLTLAAGLLFYITGKKHDKKSEVTK
jgi:hypothetical protein